MKGDTMQCPALFALSRCSARVAIPACHTDLSGGQAFADCSRAVCLLVQTIVPGNVDFVGKLGDLEWEVYHILVALRCAAFLPSYVEVRLHQVYRVQEMQGMLSRPCSVNV